MKKLLFILSLFICIAANAQRPYTIDGKVRFTKYKNTAGIDSVITTDSMGNIIFTVVHVQNFANADLIQTGNRYYDGSGHDLKMDSIHNFSISHAYSISDTATNAITLYTLFGALNINAALGLNLTSRGSGDVDITSTAGNINLVSPLALGINGSFGNSGDVLTSQGAGFPEIWAAPAVFTNTDNLDSVLIRQNGSDLTQEYGISFGGYNFGLFNLDSLYINPLKMNVDVSRDLFLGGGSGGAYTVSLVNEGQSNLITLLKSGKDSISSTNGQDIALVSDADIDMNGVLIKINTNAVFDNTGVSTLGINGTYIYDNGNGGLLGTDAGNSKAWIGDRDDNFNYTNIQLDDQAKTIDVKADNGTTFAFTSDAVGQDSLLKVQGGFNVTRGVRFSALANADSATFLQTTIDGTVIKRKIYIGSGSNIGNSDLRLTSDRTLHGANKYLILDSLSSLTATTITGNISFNSANSNVLTSSNSGNTGYEVEMENGLYTNRIEVKDFDILSTVAFGAKTDLTSTGFGINISPDSSFTDSGSARITGYVRLNKYANTDTTMFPWTDLNGTVVLRKIYPGGGGGVGGADTTAWHKGGDNVYTAVPSIGTTNNRSFNFITNNTFRGEIDSNGIFIIGDPSFITNSPTLLINGGNTAGATHLVITNTSASNGSYIDFPTNDGDVYTQIKRYGSTYGGYIHSTNIPNSGSWIFEHILDYPINTNIVVEAPRTYLVDYTGSDYGLAKVAGGIVIDIGANIYGESPRNSSTFDAHGSVITDEYKLSDMNTAPSSSSDTGIKGEIRVTATYIYICTSTNTWVRTALTTF